MRAFLFALGAIFIVSLTVFWSSAAPWLTYHDSGEFALAALSGGIPHAPGAPSYCLLAWGFVSGARLFFPSCEAAYLTNLFSGLCGALTLVLASALAGLWSRRLFSTPLALYLPLMIVPALLFYSAGFVEQACVTEQYTLLTALLSGALLTLSLLLWSERPQARRCYGLLLGVLIGLAIGNHPSQVILVPLVALGARALPRSERFRIAGIGTLGLVLGLLSYLYVPLRSRVDPVIDIGNVETWQRFLWAIRREQWQTRPISSAPPGFTTEWFLSYDFLGQLSVLGVALALVGMGTLLRRQPAALLVSLGIGVAYGGGLLVAHLRQVGIDLAYIRGYGVVDWHIPLYTLAALFAGVGASFLAERLGHWRGAGAAITLTAAGLLAGSVIVATTRHSLRHFTQPRAFVDDVLRPLPTDALIVTTGDNLSLMLGYAAYGSTDSRRFGFPERWILWGQTGSLRAIEQVLAQEGSWSTAAQAHYLERLSTEYPAYHAPHLTTEHAANSPLFVEYGAGHPAAGQYLLPTGWLFAVQPHPVSNDQVQAAERALHQRYPTLFAPGTGKENRLEREARGLMHQNRGAYFFERQLWSEAADAYDLSCTYLDRSGSVWFCLGTARENLGQLEQAQAAYLRAIEVEPNLEGPRVSLGILLAKAGHLPEAETLFTEELEHHPRSEAARANLALVQQQQAQR